MIQHHNGAVSMVKELFSTHGAGQDETVVQARLRRQRRSDDRDRAHAENAVRAQGRGTAHRDRPLSSAFAVPQSAPQEESLMALRVPVHRPSRATDRGHLLALSLAVGTRCRGSVLEHAQDEPSPTPEDRSARRSPRRPVRRRPRRRGTSRSCRRPSRRRSSSAPRTPTSRSPATTRSRATTTASRSGTSRTPQADAQDRRTTARRRRATSRSTRTCCSCRAKAIGGRLDCGGQGVQGHREQGTPPRHPHLRHHRHREPEVHRERADVPRLAHAHGGRRSEGQGQRLHLRLGLAPASARRASCRAASRTPDKDPNSSLFRIEVIKVPLANPTAAKIVSTRAHLRRASPQPKSHGEAPDDVAREHRGREGAR